MADEPTPEPIAEPTAPPADALAVPKKTDRPEWLPEKFKSGEDMAKAYGELSKKLGSEPKEDKPASESLSLKSLETYATEFSEKGELSYDSFKALEAKGISKEVVDEFMPMIVENQVRATQAVYDSVGGETAYKAMTDWGTEHMPEAEIDAFNRALKSANVATRTLAIRGLQASYHDAVGTKPQLVKAEVSNAGSGGAYESQAQALVDINNPLYKTDPAFRAKVAAKVERSSVF